VGARILVIEDNPANLHLMTYLLNAFGHETLTARDGEEGLRRAREGGVDLIICDIQLPRLDGYDIARALRADVSFSRVPLIAVTALAMVGDQERIQAAGFDGYIPKPITPERFVQDVESYLP
jgi:two-component system cell cycle response regulator